MAEISAQFETKKLALLGSFDATCPIEAEAILPEYKAEADGILRALPRVVIKNKSVHPRDGRLICEVEGAVGFHILYRVSGKDGTEQVSSFLYSEDFAQSFQIPLEESPSYGELLIFAEGDPQSCLVKLLGPRKMSVKCDLKLSLEVKYNHSLVLMEPNPAEDLITRGTDLTATRIHTRHVEELSFTQTIALPKAYLPIRELCEMEAVLLAQNVKAEDGGIVFNGLCDLQCSYNADGEDLLVSFYQPIEFQRRIGIPQVLSNHLCRVALTPVALKATTDVNEEGEHKLVLFELSYLCEVTVFENCRVFVTEDAFSTCNQLSVEKKHENVMELLGVFDYSDSVKDVLKPKHPDVKGAEAVCGKVDFQNSYLEDGKIRLEGKLSVSYLGSTETGEWIHCEETCGFKTVVNPPFSIPEGEECSIEVCGCARGIDVISEGEELQLRFELCGNVSVYVNHRPETVSRWERGDAFEKKRGEILYVYPTATEDLWSLAKEYHISPEKLKEQNHLTGDLLPRYLKLIP